MGEKRSKMSFNLVFAAQEAGTVIEGKPWAVARVGTTKHEAGEYRVVYPDGTVSEKGVIAKIRNKLVKYLPFSEAEWIAHCKNQETFKQSEKSAIILHNEERARTYLNGKDAETSPPRTRWPLPPKPPEQPPAEEKTQDPPEQPPAEENPFNKGKPVSERSFTNFFDEYKQDKNHKRFHRNMCKKLDRMVADVGAISGQVKPLVHAINGLIEIICRVANTDPPAGYKQKKKAEETETEED